MRFVDFLKATVLLSAGAATLLAALTVISLARDLEPTAVYVAAGWWLVAALIGTALGRRAEASPPIARLRSGRGWGGARRPRRRSPGCWRPRGRRPRCRSCGRG